MKGTELLERDKMIPEPVNIEVMEDLGGVTAEIIAEDRVAYNPKLAEDVRRVRRERAKTLYSDLIFSLVHLRFDEPTAREKWKEIIEHKYLISQKLGRNVGIRVAIIDYFLNVTREMKNVTMMDVMEYNEAARESVTDWLTGVFQKGYFLSAAESELRRLAVEKRKAGVFFFDIDHFKTFNDTNGHLVGDVLLRLIGNYVSDLLRDDDLMGRYGGEEFAILFPGVGLKDAFAKADDIRRTIADLPFPGQEIMPNRRITISGGVAEFPTHGAGIMELLKAADEALYSAKKAGRNRVAIADDSR